MPADGSRLCLPKVVILSASVNVQIPVATVITYHGIFYSCIRNDVFLWNPKFQHRVTEIHNWIPH